MKLEVGMYIRTKKGIAKIIKIFANDDEPYDNVNYETDTYLEIYYDSQYVSEDDVLKADYNIINILEERDYVNGQEIYYDEELNLLYVQSFDANGEFYQESITKQSFIDNIKSIVTHEQMKQMEYKVGE